MSCDLLTTKEYCVVTFPSTQCALLGEKHLVGVEVELVVIPTPREISASCGLALKLFCRNLENVKKELAVAAVATSGFYRFTKTDSGTMVVEVSGENGQK